VCGERTEKRAPKRRMKGKTARAMRSRGVGRYGEVRAAGDREGIVLPSAMASVVGLEGPVSAPRRVTTMEIVEGIVAMEMSEWVRSSLPKCNEGMKVSRSVAWRREHLG
jgi:hypothetical protein